MLTDMITRDNDTETVYAHHNLAQAEQDLANLHAGTSRWTSTPEGAAARALTAARKRHGRAQERNAEPNLGFLERRRATREATVATRSLAAAEQTWERDGRPEAERLDTHRTEAIERIAALEDPDMAREAWLDRHPTIAEQIRRLDDRIAVQRARGNQPAPQATLPPTHGRDLDLDIDIGL